MPAILGHSIAQPLLVDGNRPGPTMDPVIAYFDCFSGVSGDMALGALVDAGLPLDVLRTQLAAVELQGYRIEARKQKDGPITGTRIAVAVNDEQPVRRLEDIVRLLETSRLDSGVATTAHRVFER